MSDGRAGHDEHFAGGFVPGALMLGRAARGNVRLGLLAIVYQSAHSIQTGTEADVRALVREQLAKGPVIVS